MGVLQCNILGDVIVIAIIILMGNGNRNCNSTGSCNIRRVGDEIVIVIAIVIEE